MHNTALEHLTAGLAGPTLLQDPEPLCPVLISSRDSILLDLATKIAQKTQLGTGILSPGKYGQTILIASIWRI